MPAVYVYLKHGTEHCSILQPGSIEELYEKINFVMHNDDPVLSLRLNRRFILIPKDNIAAIDVY